MDIPKLIEMYEEGSIVEREVIYQLFDTVAAEEIKDIPPLWLEKLKKHVAALPANEYGWARMMCCGMGWVICLEDWRSAASKRADFLRKELWNSNTGATPQKKSTEDRV